MPYYHGSTNYIKNDSILFSKENEGYTSQAEVLLVENFMEKHRPENKISRLDCVYLVDNLEDIDFVGAFSDYVYEVDPINQVEKSDLHWYTQVSLIDLDDPKAIIYAKNYWNGTYSDNPVFEYRCENAKVLSMIENNIDDDEFVKKNNNKFKI